MRLTLLAPTPDFRIAIRASPRGIRAGFAVLPDGAGGNLTVTILPKPWRKAGGERLLTPRHDPGTTTHVTMYESEIVEVQSTQSVIGSLTQAILEISSIEGRQYLLELVRARAEGVPVSQPDVGEFETLVNLMLLAKRQRSSLTEQGFRGTAVPSLLRLVQQHLFVTEVRRVIDRARPTYVERVDRLSSPRGKLSGSSLAIALLTGTPWLESRFDEQSTDTTVLRIVLAGLRAVATDRVPAHFAAVAGPIRSSAVGLAGRLEGVAILDTERALLAARSLVVDVLDRPWAEAVDLAIQVLSRKSVVPADGTIDTPRAASIHLYMEKWWEQCLADGLRLIADPGSFHEQVPVPPPWGPVTASGLPPFADASFAPVPEQNADATRKADFIFSMNERRVLADAKYKMGSHSLGAADGYQMFSYSHTASVPISGQSISEGAVFYPLRASGTGRSRGHRQTKLMRATNPRFILRLVDLPFASPADVRTDTAWHHYVAVLASGIRRALNETV
ncbi:hypothetical protein ACFQU3_19815 [Terrabacter sp. GCM10028922]|uniref:hypothetical protein n=1 Tax=Terrabacter sp. GCM10028922 TaxID=3273428 RepID=UPI0036227890